MGGGGGPMARRTRPVRLRADGMIATARGGHNEGAGGPGVAVAKACLPEGPLPGAHADRAAHPLFTTAGRWSIFQPLEGSEPPGG